MGHLQSHLPFPAYTKSAADDVKSIPEKNWKLPLSVSKMIESRIENMLTKEEIAQTSNFFFCRHIFKKPSAADLNSHARTYKFFGLILMGLGHPQSTSI